MTTTDARAVAPTRGGGTSADRRARLLVGVFALTQTVGYGVLFYTFSVVLAPIAVDLHTDTTTVTGAFTLSILIAAAASIPVGRWLDRRGARALMTTGSALGTLAVAGLSQAHTITQLYAAYVLIGLAGAAVLYDAAFTVVIHQVHATRRSNALLAITIVAGFASTIFLPITGWLTEQWGWRAALLTLAILYGLITIPAHALAVPAIPPTSRPTETRHTVEQQSTVGEAIRDRGFWLMAAAFVAHGAAVSAISVHLVRYLTTLGHTAALAATMAGLLGALSVTGRLVTTGLARRYAMTTVVALVFAVQAAAAALLPVAGHHIGGAMACVAAFGLGFGVATIARPAILADRYGTTAYGTISGALNVPITVAKATAPLAAAAIAGTTLMIAVAALCLMAAVSLGLGLHRHRRVAHISVPAMQTPPVTRRL